MTYVGANVSTHHGVQPTSYPCTIALAVTATDRNILACHDSNDSNRDNSTSNDSNASTTAPAMTATDKNNLCNVAATAMQVKVMQQQQQQQHERFYSSNNPHDAPPTRHVWLKQFDFQDPLAAIPFLQAKPDGSQPSQNGNEA